MLQHLRINPKLSACMQLFGVFDYNTTLLAPLGTKALIHQGPKQRGTFEDHGKIAFIIGHAMEHYQKLTFYFPSTRGIRNTDTYVFIPSKFELPKKAAADRATVTLEEFTDTIKKPATKAISLKQTSINKDIEALTTLSSLNKKATTTKGIVVCHNLDLEYQVLGHHR